MPKVLLYITAKIIWTLLFYNKDYNENRAHVHIGKKGTEQFCKIWLEPKIEVAKKGDLTEAQLKEVLQIVTEQHAKLMQQWENFKAGKAIRMIKVKK